MRYFRYLVVLSISFLLIFTFSCNGDSETGTTVEVTSTPITSPSSESSPSSLPTSPKPPTLCETQSAAIQEAVNLYQDEHKEWPTHDGKPGNIQWEKLVPDVLANEPSTDYQCDWQIDDDPEGTVCLPPENYC